MKEKLTALTAAALVCLMAFVAAPVVRAAGNDIVERNMRTEDLPRAVRDSIQKEYGNAEIRSITQLSSGNRNIYRVTLANRDGVFVSRVADDGRILGRQEAVDKNQKQVAWDQLPKEVQRVFDEARGAGDNRGDIQRIISVDRGNRTLYTADITDKSGLRTITVDDRGNRAFDDNDVKYLSTGGAAADDFTSQLDRGDWSSMKYADLPRAVQRTMDERRNRLELAHLHRVNTGREVRYEGIILDPRGGDRQIIVAEDGKLLSDRALPANDPNAAFYRADRRTLKYNDLPREVQRSLDKLRPRGAEVAHINEIRTGKGTEYSAIIVDRGVERRVIVRDDGKVIEDRNLK